MAYFTKSIDKYLAYWVGKDTCLTPQDIEDNFYPFVIAIDRKSRRLKDKTRSPDDPDIADLLPEAKQRILNKRILRNPRTYDMSNFRDKVSLAIKSDHPDWNEEYIDEEVQKLSKKAGLILDALWSDRVFPHRCIDGDVDPYFLSNSYSPTKSNI
jgi:hypothetical protein